MIGRRVSGYMLALVAAQLLAEGRLITDEPTPKNPRRSDGAPPLKLVNPEPKRAKRRPNGRIKGMKGRP